MDRFNNCPSCGFAIGPYYQFFDAARAALISEFMANNEKYKNYDPSKIYLSSDVDISYEPIFDVLQLNPCCRIKISTRIDFCKLYK
jgi:hypothetical protein